jgi:hypothetical protein
MSVGTAATYSCFPRSAGLVAPFVRCLLQLEGGLAAVDAQFDRGITRVGSTPNCQSRPALAQRDRRSRLVKA